MGDATSISWCDATWNPIRGCSRVSEGCRHCYAERVAGRFCGPGQAYEGLAQRKLRVIDGDTERLEGRWTGEVRMVPEHLADPLKWRRPRRIFVNSMSDLFHEKLSNERIAAVFGVMAAAPRHTFQVLTKRALRMRDWFRWMEEKRHDNGDYWTELMREACSWLDAAVEEALSLQLVEDGIAREGVPEHEPWPLPNVWLGVSVENQAAADERIPTLLETPAAVRFLSCEPLIGEVDLDMPRCGYPNHEESWGVADDGATPWCAECDSERSYGHWLGDPDEGIAWVIVGCESGPGARSCGVHWLRSLRDQCATSGNAFFLKQAVEQLAGAPSAAAHHVAAGTGSKRKAGGVIELPYLDGVQHAAFPEVR